VAPRRHPQAKRRTKPANRPLRHSTRACPIWNGNRPPNNGCGRFRTIPASCCGESFSTNNASAREPIDEAPDGFSPALHPGRPGDRRRPVRPCDRTQLSIDETLELSLESQGGAVFGKPDLEPLEELFEVFDTRQVNQLSSSNGEARAITRWLITLRPRQTGYVVIPPLQLGDWRSEPITLLVQESLKSSEGDQLAPIFIDSSVDQESVYVQAQVILTLRIYHSVSLYDDSTLSPLQMPEALVERLGEPRTYEKTINGIRHGVIEVRYALFPQKSGELTIPAQITDCP